MGGDHGGQNSASSVIVQLAFFLIFSKMSLKYFCESNVSVLFPFFMIITIHVFLPWYEYDIWYLAVSVLVKISLGKYLAVYMR